VSNFIETVRKEWDIISGAPWSFVTVFVAMFVLLAGGSWFFVQQINSATISGKDATIEAQKAQIDSYKDKLSGATPDEAKAKIADLEARLAKVEGPASEEIKSLRDQVSTLTQQLDVTTKERDQARQQLSIQAQIVSSAPKPAAPLSDDEKQFRIDLRSFVKSTLQTHYDSFFGLANVASGGQVGGPIVPAEIKPRADAAYTLLQDSLRGEFQRSWTELNDSANTTIDGMNPTNTVELLKRYTDNYWKAVVHFKDYLIIVGSTEDTMNLLAKWSEADAQAKRDFQKLMTYPRSVTSGLEKIGAFPAQAMGEVTPYLKHEASQQ